MTIGLGRRLTAEALGSILLTGTVVGSGILASRLAGGNDAVVLLGNTAATGAILFVLISALGPIARAMSDTFAGVRPDDVPVFIVAQMAGALLAWLVCSLLFPKAAKS